MPVFAYRGLDAGGRSVKGVVDADSARTARAKLRATGTYPTELNEESTAAERETAAREWLPSLWRRKMPASDLALLTRQLSALLGAGVQLVDALVAHRDVFSDLYIGMVRAGEQAAALEAVLDRLAEYSERQSEFITKVRGALTYPIIMMCVGTAIMAFLVAYVVPQVATIFEQQHAALPLATKILITFSGMVTTYWLPIGLLLIAMVAGLTGAMATPRGRRIYDTMILKMWYVGPTMIRIICARFARTLATLLASGVQLLPALDAVKGVVTNGLLKDAV